jgi:TonB family protein
MAIVLLLAVVVPLFAIAGSNENQTELSNADIVKQCQELRLSASEYPACERAAAEELIKTQTVQHPTCGEDYYPAEALRLNQGGVVVARVCVGTNNRVDGPVEVIASSGVPELDEAATKCLAGGVYKAGTVNGVPARTCKDVKITFNTPVDCPCCGR